MRHTRASKRVSNEGIGRRGGGGNGLTAGFQHIKALSLRRFLLWFEQLSTVLRDWRDVSDMIADSL